MALTSDSVNNTVYSSYPILIAQQASDSLRASLLFQGILRIATNQYLKYPWGLWKIKQNIKISKTSWDHSFNSVIDRAEIFEDSIAHNATISMVSQWDWFISKIGNFIIFAHSHKSQISLDKDIIDRLKQISKSSFIRKQLRIIKEASNVSIDYSDSSEDFLYELNCVRNVGIHNNWEVDEDYKKNSPNKDKWDLGQYRRVSVNEVEVWERELLQLIIRTATLMDERYNNIPLNPTL